MKYENVWKKTLNEDEKVEHEFSIAKKYRKQSLISWAVLSLVIAVLLYFPLGFYSVVFGIVFLLLGALDYWRLGLQAYALTNRRLLIHSGWLSTQSTSVYFDKIVEVSVTEQFLNRLISKSGNIVIKTGGFGHDIILSNIESPYELKKILDRLSHQSK